MSQHRKAQPDIAEPIKYNAERAKQLENHSAVESVEYNDGEEYAELIVVFEGMFGVDFVKQHHLSFREAWITQKAYNYREYLNRRPRLVARFLAEATEETHE
jgi:hypothetical protein